MIVRQLTERDEYLCKDIELAIEEELNRLKKHDAPFQIERAREMYSEQNLILMLREGQTRFYALLDKCSVYGVRMERCSVKNNSTGESITRISLVASHGFRKRAIALVQDAIFCAKARPDDALKMYVASGDAYLRDVALQLGFDEVNNTNGLILYNLKGDGYRW